MHDFPVIDFSCPEPSRGEILNKSILTEVWEDMDATTLPSWIGRPPQLFGSTGQGKTKADQWRTICTVNLPITLIRLWGQKESSDEDVRLLNNFLALVIAVHWATMRSTSVKHQQVVQAHLTYYLKSLVELFGADVLTVNHHISLHLTECLRLFGPVHGWWSFPFERYNGVVQRLKTNSKIGRWQLILIELPFNIDALTCLGELEVTFFRTFCRMTNFKSLVMDGGIALSLGQYRETIFRHFCDKLTERVASDLRTLDLEDPWAEMQSQLGGAITKPVALTGSAYSGLLQCLNRNAWGMRFCSFDDLSLSGASTFKVDPLVRYGTNLVIRGIKFTTERHSAADSMVLFRPTPDFTPVAGRIKAIFSHCHPGASQDPITEHFLILQKYRQIDHDEHSRNPYRQYYKTLGISLYRDEFSEEEYVIHSSQIMNHIATCPYRDGREGRNYRVILDIGRVRMQFSLET